MSEEFSAEYEDFNDDDTQFESHLSDADAEYEEEEISTDEVDRVLEKPRRERQRRLLKQGYDAPDVTDAVGVYEKTIRDLDELLSGQPWLAGDEFSLADAAMAPYFQTPFQFGWSDWYASRSRVAQWYERCRARDSYRSAVADDFSAKRIADLKQRGEPAWLKIQSIIENMGAQAA